MPRDKILFCAIFQLKLSGHHKDAPNFESSRRDTLPLLYWQKAILEYLYFCCRVSMWTGRRFRKLPCITFLGRIEEHVNSAASLPASCRYTVQFCWDIFAWYWKVSLLLEALHSLIERVIHRSELEAKILQLLVGHLIRLLPRVHFIRAPEHNHGTCHQRCSIQWVLREEFAEDVDDVLTVQHALGAEVPAGSLWHLEHVDVCAGHVAHIHIRLHGVGVLLGRAVEVLEDVRSASVHRRLQQWPDNEHRVHDDEVDVVLPGRLPRGLLRHGLAVAVPVLVHHAIEASEQVVIRHGAMSPTAST